MKQNSVFYVTCYIDCTEHYYEKHISFLKLLDLNFHFVLSLKILLKYNIETGQIDSPKCAILLC